MLKGARWKRALRQSLAPIHRELLLTWTPVPKPRCWGFLLGCYNSGTTLLNELIAQHPQVGALPHEGHFLTDQMPVPWEMGLPRMWVLREDLFRLTENDAGPDAIRLKKEWGLRLNRSTPVVIEKSPPNVARIRWLQANFENAHFVAIVRNGYAVAEGIRRKAEPVHQTDGWPLEACARQWSRSNRVLVDDGKHLDRILWLRYEELTDNPKRELERIYEFLGVSEASQGLDIDRTWQIHERDQAIRNLNAESIGRLTHSEIEVISEIAGPMLEHFGYELL